jgi:hypothetical protein
MAKGSGGSGTGGRSGGSSPSPESVALSAYGGSVWEKGGQSRVYLDRNKVMEAGGIKITKRGSGSIERATVNGETISANAGANILENSRNVYLDRNSGSLVAPKSGGRDYGAWDKTIEKIGAHLNVPIVRK